MQRVWEPGPGSGLDLGRARLGLGPTRPAQPAGFALLLKFFELEARFLATPVSCQRLRWTTSPPRSR